MKTEYVKLRESMEATPEYQEAASRPGASGKCPVQVLCELREELGKGWHAESANNELFDQMDMYMGLRPSASSPGGFSGALGGGPKDADISSSPKRLESVAPPPAPSVEKRGGDKRGVADTAVQIAAVFAQVDERAAARLEARETAATVARLEAQAAEAEASRKHQLALEELRDQREAKRQKHEADVLQSRQAEAEMRLATTSLIASLLDSLKKPTIE